MIYVTWCLLLFIGFSNAWMDDRPVLESRDGNLFISSARDKNISLNIIGKGFVNVNNVNLLHVALTAQNATRWIDRMRLGYVASIERDLQRLYDIVDGPTGLQKRVHMLEWNGDTNVTPNKSSSEQSIPSDVTARNGLRRLNEKIRKLETKVNTMLMKLKEDDCQSDPCANGATCEDLYDGFKCHCPPNWTGRNCMTDVNECAQLLGTDLGCQNGATCVNLVGSYRCDCAVGWNGIHCNRESSICNALNSEELCGHGVCVTKTSSLLGYVCICDQGWQSDGINPSCTKDVDECAAKHPPCSINPPVACINTPSSFYCGSCPHGYTGNGYYCTDIDECSFNNGGCSTSPRVQCINTMGSRVCASCPTGYEGDGVTCAYSGPCKINNGGCHPLATCVATTNIYVECRCPSGYRGDGMGPRGCQPSTDLTNTACSSNPCKHGTCSSNDQTSYTCQCDPGYTGKICDTSVDPCSPNPCKNGGTCVSSNGHATCDCTSGYTGNNCETSRQTCGGYSRNSMGHLEFPSSGTNYQPKLNCAWVVITNHSLVLNVTFSKFKIEKSADCKFDFLQIHDGRNAGSQVIGRFCGDEAPNHGNIISSHNALYFWFNSDSSVSSEGFAFHWNSIEPVCGGYLPDAYGLIKSPGSPGKYPPNRDCYWAINVGPGKRIQFHFGQLMLEEHPTCDYDYVEITDHEEHQLGKYCNRTHPSPLITPGPQAILLFHSDSAGQDSGFQIFYSTIEGSPGCGGIHTEFSGVITSPYQSTGYRSNIECEWKIQLPRGERIKIMFLSFDVEDSTGCKFDALEIYDGGATDSALIGRFCGQDLPQPIKSTSNELLIIFKSDWSLEMEGFKLSYEILCDNQFVKDTGIITSPMYPNSYPASRTCTYEIILSPGKTIALTMLDMEIEGSAPPDCFFDLLEIFDGDSENSTRLTSLCGDEDIMPTEPIFSTVNYMFLKFTTDGSVHNRGFKANYTTIDRKCGGLYKTATGMIKSPGETYENDEECIWTLQAPPGYVVQLSWTNFYLEYHVRCQRDYVNVYDGPVISDSNLIGKFCGSKQPPMLTTQNHTMTVVFQSDSSVVGEGFAANYIFIDATKMCGGHYFHSNGIIRSPNYPNDYPQKRECIWIIEAPNKQRITLQIESFHLENHTSCYFDYLELRNGGYETSPLIGKYCGVEIPETIVSHTNQIYVKFVSDGSRSAPGFSITWNSTAEGCGGLLTSANGDVTSPNYPQPYADFAECVWKIVIAAGSRIQLVFVDMQLEGTQNNCRFDYLEIYEGNDRRKGATRYCGNSSPAVLQTKSNTVTIRFRSDFTTVGRGFHIKYETLCHNLVHGHRGIIESPNFPNNYPHNTNCSWTIEAPVGNKLNITFSHFDLEGPREEDCVLDYLELKEGTENVPSNELGKYCGTNNPPTKINSKQHQVFVNFITDNFISDNGFRLEWLTDGCGGHLTKPTDSFTSPGYPGPYPERIDCEWLIEVDFMHSVEITFNEVSTEKIKGCRFDKIQVYGGEDETAPKLIELCHSDKPVTYTSPGNKMFVKFHSDFSWIDRGFSATYKTVSLNCGGLFTAANGLIQSANYPLNYPHNQNCEWLIRVDRHHVVNITFDDFDIEDSKNCTDDYVKVIDGSTRNDVELGTHCHNELPPSYVSTGNEMLIVMRTDSLITAKGFKAIYRRSCGARVIVKDQGYISTASNLDEQRDIINCTWILTAEDPADHITLTFTHMENEYEEIDESQCDWHNLKVYEGDDLTGPLLGTWCSHKVPPSITSRGSSLTIHLYSVNHNYNNFAATYSVLNSGFEDPKSFPPARSFLIAKNDIEKSDVFKFIKIMPKGAVLHSHKNGIVSQDYVYSNITFRDNLYICSTAGSLRMKFFDKPDNDICEWKLLSECRKNQSMANQLNENIQKSLTMIVDNPEQVYTDIDTTWSKFQGIFEFVHDMLTYLPVFKDYIWEGLEELRNDNVMYLELRTTLPLLYELNGVYKTELDTVQVLKEINDRFVKEYQDFMGFKLIYAPQRFIDGPRLHQHMTLARELVEKYPNFVVGFDLVGQEDKGGLLKNMTDELQKNSLNLNYFFHAGETNWNGMNTDENLFDAVLLGAKRIGHGYAITKHPALLKLIRTQQIAIEVSPISNQVLHLVKDMRNHPASILFANNYPVVVSNDDPGWWGATGLSYDFYEAFMGIMSAKADIRSLKQLAINSLEYSSMNDEEKSRARSIFDEKWDKFLIEIRKLQI